MKLVEQVLRFLAYRMTWFVHPLRRTNARDRVHDAIVRIADRVRDLLDTPGIELVVDDLDERRTAIRLRRPPLRRILIDLGEARDVLYRLVGPRDDRDAHLVVAALLARDLAPVRVADDWERLRPFVAAILGRLGADVHRAVEIVEAIVTGDEPE